MSVDRVDVGYSSTESSACCISTALGLFLMLRQLLLGRDPVAQRQRDALRLGADAHVALDGAIRPVLNGDIHQRILAKHGARVQVRCQEGDAGGEGVDGRQDAHVGLAGYVADEVVEATAAQLRGGRK